MAKKEKEVKTLHELIVLNPTLKASLMQFESAKTQLDAVAQQCMLIKVTDSDSLAVCENNLTKVNDLCTAVEVIRKEKVERPWHEFKTINAAAAYISESSESAVEYLKLQKKTYILKEEAEKKRLEDLKAKVEAMTLTMKTRLESMDDVAKLDSFVEKMKAIDFKEKYADYSAQAEEIAEGYHKLFAIKRIELEALVDATPDEVEAIKQASEEAKELVQEIIIDNSVSMSATTFSAPAKKVRRPWAFEVIDLTKVPKEWLMLDESKVKAFMADNKDTLVEGQQINGVKFFKDLTITA